jgi:oligosaccharide repeat unit polymerase
MRAVAGTWLNPGALFALWWCMAGISPLLFAPREPVAPAAMAWVILASICVSAGAVIGNRGFKTYHPPKPPVPRQLERSVLSAIMLVSLILGLGSSVAFASGTGFPLRDLFSIERLVSFASETYSSRLGEVESVAPAASRALLPFVYLAPTVGGIVYVLRRQWKWKLLALSSILPAIVVTLLQTTKAAILFSASLWLSGYFATRLRLGRLGVFTRGHIVTAMVIGGTATVFFLGIGLSRYASTDLSLLGLVQVKLVTATFGHMSVFSGWLTDYWHQPIEPTLGGYTLAGPLDMIGLGRRVPGLFDNPMELIAGETSNIFTGFRPLIEDFTIPGALAVLIALGATGGAAFRLVSRGGWGAVPVLVAVYVTMLWTPITWFWVYNSLIAAVMAMAVAVWILRTWRRAAQARPLIERTTSPLQ